MLKYFFSLFLIVLFAATCFFTFSYFATEEYGGTGMLYSVLPYISVVSKKIKPAWKLPSWFDFTSIYFIKA